MKTSEAISESIRAVICLDDVPNKFDVLRIMFGELESAERLEKYQGTMEVECDAETV